MEDVNEQKQDLRDEKKEQRRSADPEPGVDGGDDEGTSGGDPRDTQCGVLGWRPDPLQPFAHIWWFTATISAYTVFGNVNYTYYSAVITQIERRFGLSSAMTGFIKNVDNIGFMLTVVVVSHLCRYSNKPRLFAISAVLNAFSIFLFGLPHFLFSAPPSGLSAVQQPLLANQTMYTPNSQMSGSHYDTCDIDGPVANQTAGECRSRSTVGEFHSGAMALFIISEILQGMAVAPKVTMSMTYIDDNVKDQSPAHFGVMFAMRAMSPLLGFLLGAWTNSIYVDLTDPGIDQRDPRWVGAWWIGFMICAATTVLWAIPLILFPSRMKGTKKASKQDQDLLSNSKDLPKALWRIISNPIYLFCLLAGCFNTSLIGFSTFIPKYIAAQFGVTASVSSIYTGFISLLSWAVGPVVSGFMMTRFKMTAATALKFVLVVHAIAVTGYTITMFIGCPQSAWAGQMDSKVQIKDAACNADCACDPNSYTPVCGSDGVNYFSPCYAGCLPDSNVTSTRTFEKCACVGTGPDGEEEGGGTAKLGLCPRTCNVMYLYMIILLTTGFVTSMTIVPTMTTFLRCVEERDKAMAMAFFAFIMQLLGFPAPLIYGRVIDSTCVVVQTSCTRQGACLLYDQDQFRLRLHALPAVAKLGAMSMYSIALYMCLKRDRVLAQREAVGKALAERIKAENNNGQELRALGEGEPAEKDAMLERQSDV